MYSKRSGSPSRHRHSSSRRSPSPRKRSPGPSRRRERSREPETQPQRGENELPTQFGGKREELESGVRPDEDDRNVLEKMEKSYATGPLHLLHQACKEHARLKIWTRNFKEIRGICTGFIVAFDKHWNLVLEDVDEICLKPKKGKTPYLYEVKPEGLATIPEAQPPKLREKKKAVAGTEVERAEAEEGEIVPEVAAPVAGSSARPKRRRVRKKKKTRMDRRCVDKLFIRGDNVVMMAIITPSVEDTKAKEKETKKK